jgi:hypothetical protein
MATTHTTLRFGTYDDVHSQVEQLARDLDPNDYLAGTWLRELTVAVALHDGLVVSVVTYDGGGQELEVRLADAPSSDGIVIGRRASGDECQISLDLWVAIKDQSSREQAVGLVQALLRASASVVQG